MIVTSTLPFQLDAQFHRVSHGSHNHTVRDCNPLVVAPSSHMQLEAASIQSALFNATEEYVTEQRTMNM